jgi:hypothetical protein
MAKAAIDIQIESTKDWSSTTVAEGILDALENTGLTPIRYGECEPFRGDYEQDGRQAILDMWRAPRRRGHHQGMELFVVRKRSPKLLAIIGWDKHTWECLNTCLFSIEEKGSPGKAGSGEPQSVGPLLRALVPVLSPTWSQICTDGEREAVGYYETVDRSGPPRDLVINVLPGLYWGNLFGPQYVELIGRERLFSAPAHRVEDYPEGCVCLVAYEDPNEWHTLQAQAAKRAIIRHLGEDLFFDRDRPSGPWCAPKYDFSEILLPPPEESEEPEHGRDIHLDLVPDAEAFVRQVPELLLRLQGRLRKGHMLDFSVESLHVVGDYIRHRRRKGTPEENVDIVQELAAYFGEVLVRNLNGRWAVEETKGVMAPVVRRGPGPGRAEPPFCRVWKMWDEPSDSLHSWYQVIASGLFG